VSAQSTPTLDLLELAKRPATSVIVFTAVIVVAFSIQTGGTWISQANMASVLQVSATLGIMTLGEALVITAREIDISVGSIFGIGALVYLGSASTIGAFPAVILAVVCGAAIGALNGLLVTRFRVSALIATLGTLFVFRGICYALTEGFSFSAGEPLRQSVAYAIFGGYEFFGFKDSILWLVVLVAVLHVVVFATPFGNRLLALGGDDASALSRGVRVTLMKWQAFVLSGILAAFAGVLEASKIGFADGSFGRLQELQAIAACVIGGCLLTGGRCSMVGAALGAFALTGIQSVLVLNGVQPQWYNVLLGVIIVVALIADKSLRAWALSRS
jgi:ribose transport system permease protein